MAEFILEAKKREKAGKDLYMSRKQDLIPAIAYGHGSETHMVWIKYLDFSRVYAQAGESSLIKMSFGTADAVNVLIHDVQRHPLSNRFTHVDFFQVHMNEKLEAHIPLEFVGEAPAVRGFGGVLVKPIEEVLVSCLPKDLPHSLPVDLAVLKTFDHQIQVKDISVPAGVEILTDVNSVIALVEAPRSEAEMAALDEKVEADVTKVEGVTKTDAENSEKNDVKEK
ncbi:MAG: 50S ribosomal protein L25 [Minisyncoccota bacterium]